MPSCFKCGVDESRAILFDAISSKGIVKICRKCSIIEGLPIIKKNTEQEDDEKRKVAENFARNQTMESRRFGRPPPRNDDLALRNLVDSNFRKNLIEDVEFKKTLIDNFHWALMRERRGKKMTQEQLAVALREPVIAINTLERGIVPEKSKELIMKIENFLFVKLRKPVSIVDEKKTKIDFRTPGNVKIADLRDMKEEHKDQISEESLDDELYDLSKDEMDELKRDKV